ncbi:MAG: hypothetical protein DBY20_01530 [Coriobacteriia bacterium]|nr:MAG: hypothetical protein DBY20_01530 [Coriobacteriia bacterium]
MFDNNQPQSGIQTLFGPNGNVSAVVGSSPNTFAVIGSGDHDGVYFRNGNIVSGPDGMHAVIGDSPIKTVFDPNGEAHAIIENGSSGTVL